uniref:Uncharacterized protein n=1 Tax=Meloidogyne incognita TaxID=6306 RepID=A0A914MR03_MELIC
MGWCKFKFLFCFRLVLATIAHFNWLTAIYVNCIFFTLWKSYDIFWFWFHLFLCICFPSLRPENYLIVFIRLIRAKYGEYSDKSFKEIYEQFYIYNEGETKAEVEVRRVESLRRERRKGRNNKNDSFANEEEDIEIGRPSIDPNLIENEEQSMPNICLDRQNEAKESKQDHLEVLITYREPPATDRKGMKKFIPSFLIKSKSQKRAEKIEEAKRLQETDKEKAEKLLARHKRKEKKRREKALLAVLKERARIERSRKIFADSVEVILTWCRLRTSFAIYYGNLNKLFMPPRNSDYKLQDIMDLHY